MNQLHVGENRILIRKKAFWGGMSKITGKKQLDIIIVANQKQHKRVIADQLGYGFQLDVVIADQKQLDIII